MPRRLNHVDTADARLIAGDAATGRQRLSLGDDAEPTIAGFDGATAGVEPGQCGRRPGWCCVGNPLGAGRNVDGPIATVAHAQPFDPSAQVCVDVHGVNLARDPVSTPRCAMPVRMADAAGNEARRALPDLIGDRRVAQGADIAIGAVPFELRKADPLGIICRERQAAAQQQGQGKGEDRAHPGDIAAAFELWQLRCALGTKEPSGSLCQG